MLTFRRVFAVSARDERRRQRAIVNENAITKCRRLSFRNGPASILIRIAAEFAPRERIRGQQPVAAGVPCCRMPEAGWMIEDHDAHRTTGDHARDGYPVGPLAPNGLLALTPGGVDHAAE